MSLLGSLCLIPVGRRLPHLVAPSELTYRRDHQTCPVLPRRVHQFGRSRRAIQAEKSEKALLSELATSKVKQYLVGAGLISAKARSIDAEMVCQRPMIYLLLLLARHAQEA